MAAGSQVVWGGWESKVCANPACGRKLTLKAGGAFHHPADGEPWSTCIDCVGFVPEAAA